jgi:nucleoside-diphosphate-sugar epimerase
MNVPVTGGAGVLGLSVVTKLRSQGHRALKARKLIKRLIPLALPFKFSHQFASGCLLAPDHKDGKITFEQYLEEKYPE